MVMPLIVPTGPSVLRCPSRMNRGLLVVFMRTREIDMFCILPPSTNSRAMPEK